MRHCATWGRTRESAQVLCDIMMRGWIAYEPRKAKAMADCSWESESIGHLTVSGC